MLCDQPKKILTGNGSGLIPLKFGVHVPESDQAIFTFQDVFFLNDAFIKVAAQIDQSLITLADVFEGLSLFAIYNQQPIF